VLLSASDGSTLFMAWSTAGGVPWALRHMHHARESDLLRVNGVVLNVRRNVFRRSMRIALLHNRRPDTLRPGVPDDAFEEYDRPETIAAVARALEDLGTEVEPVDADARLPWRLDEGRYDFVFNIAEGRGRHCREAVPAAVCELLGLPFTGSDALTLGLTLDKALARRVVSPDVPVARGLLVSAASLGVLSALAYPVIVKPNDEGSSKGIRADSVVDTPAAAVERARALQRQYSCPVLVEEFLPGAEVTVGVIGNGEDASVIGMMEVAPAADESRFVYSVAMKRDWPNLARYHRPPRVSADAIAALCRYALTAYRLLGCRDIARMDFRLDADGMPRFIECNALPGLARSSDMVLLAEGVRSQEALIQGVLLDAARRHDLPLR